MIKPEQIPDEVVTAFRDAWMDADKTTKGAIAAAINAWPSKAFGIDLDNKIQEVLLPLPQEKNDD